MWSVVDRNVIVRRMTVLLLRICFFWDMIPSLDGWMDGSHSSEHFIAFISKGLKAKTLQSFEMVETAHVMGQCHVPEDVKSR